MARITTASGAPDLRRPLSPSQQAAVEKIWRHDLTFLVDRVQSKRIMPRGIAEKALEEYRRFMLMSLLDDEVPMFSPEVDEIWHAHVLFTRSYAKFCEDVFGYFVHHQPELEHEAAEQDDAEVERERRSFFAAYRALFGEPSFLWGKPPEHEAT